MPRPAPRPGHLDVPSPCGHAGGLATGGDGNLYVADTHTLFVAPLDATGNFRKIALGPGLTGGLAMSATDGIWLGTYREDAPGRLYHFTTATLAVLKDGDTLRADQAATAIAIPDYAQGAATGAGALWIARSELRAGARSTGSTRRPESLSIDTTWRRAPRASRSMRAAGYGRCPRPECGISTTGRSLASMCRSIRWSLRSTPPRLR